MRLECGRDYRSYRSNRSYMPYNGNPESNHQEKDHEFPEA